ncbi:hypothetical protein FRC12_024928 [Ceratobasidium sp. 428]|nr:hypothetical protein FRC12_024928 [Ceratobasidium sp. 428]
MESLGWTKADIQSTQVALTRKAVSSLSAKGLDQVWSECQTGIWQEQASNVVLDNDVSGEVGLAGEEEEEAAAATPYNMGWEADAGVECWKKEKYDNIRKALGLGKELLGQKEGGQRLSWQQLVARAEAICQAFMEEGSEYYTHGV